MNLLLRIAALVLSLAATVAAGAAYGVKDIPNVQLADSTRFVSDPAGVLSPDAVAEIDRMIAATRRHTTAEIALVVVDEADTDDLDSFATDLFTLWGLGRKDNDNGLLILISRDQRRAVIRTGRGMEGVLPDAVCNRIIRNVMAPDFREGRYDDGTLAAVKAVAEVLEAPANAMELRGAVMKSEESLASVLASFFAGWIVLGIVLAIAAWIWLKVRSRSIGKGDLYAQYYDLRSMRTGLMVIGVVGLGIPLVVWWVVRRRMKRVRHTPRQCPQCHDTMQLLDEEADNQYLTAPQDTEERINSVDYDVWLCPRCHATEVLPYVNTQAGYTPCKLCHARSARMVRSYTLRQPTAAKDGVMARVYKCRHCGNQFEEYTNIPKVVTPIIIPGGGGGGRGGFGGGGFGGGMTLGGGSSGGW